MTASLRVAIKDERITFPDMDGTIAGTDHDMSWVCPNESLLHSSIHLYEGEKE